MKKKKEASKEKVMGSSAMKELASLLGKLPSREEEEPPPPPEVVKEVFIRPSASKTDLFLACAWPWWRKVPAEASGVPARFGSAYHYVMASGLERARDSSLSSEGNPPIEATAVAQASKRYGVKPEGVRGRYEESFKVLWAWLKEGNPWGLDFTPNLRVEKSFALSLSGEAASRQISNPTEEGHEYVEASDEELAGTADLYSTARDNRGLLTLLVLDHKSGYVEHDATASAQLIALALMIAPTFQPDRIVLAILRAAEGEKPDVFPYETTLAEMEKAKYQKELERAYRRSREEPRSLTPGPHCGKCSAWAVCPTNTTGLMELRGGVGAGALTTPEAIGKAHQTLKEHESRFKALAEVIDGNIREAVGVVGFGLRPDGQEVSFKTVPRTNLSQASIIRALGPELGRKVIGILDKAGCVEHTEHEELRASRP